MTTLNTPPLAPLLDDLFTKAAAATTPALATMDADERTRLLHSKTEYSDFYSRLKDLWLPVSRGTGTLLYMLTSSTHARSVVEFGTSFGLSTLHMAAALKDNGGGKLITTEFEPSKVARSREHFEAAGLGGLIEIREGDALQTLAVNLPSAIDLLLLDGAKALYTDVLRLVEPHLKPGALIVADNADFTPDYLPYVRAADNGYLSLPFASDIELSMRLG
ncbi:MAG TPA: class I SAM-dependent methyltransferase [Oleiagrimonas sp.]|nr:class I SAM-dependent methyltransferase [Oleiagrimonas sp.]